MPRVLEICVDSTEAALAAETAGADRLELCSHLDIGGTTPSAGLVKHLLATCQLEVTVLVRPRAGSFCYSAQEKHVQVADVRCLREMGAHGVVVGALTPEGELDKPFLAELIDAAQSIPVTFHRAFDSIAQTPERVPQALQDLAQLGFRRLLTSGGACRAWDNAEQLAKCNSLCKQLGIELLVGGGVRSDHASELLRLSGAQQFHSSARKPNSSTAPSTDEVDSTLFGDAPQQVLDTDEIRALSQALRESTSA